MCMCVCISMKVPVPAETRGFRSPGPGITGDCELPMWVLEIGL